MACRVGAIQKPILALSPPASKEASPVSPLPTKKAILWRCHHTRKSKWENEECFFFSFFSFDICPGGGLLLSFDPETSQTGGTNSCALPVVEQGQVEIPTAVGIILTALAWVVVERFKKHSFRDVRDTNENFQYFILQIFSHFYDVVLRMLLIQ